MLQSSNFVDQDHRSKRLDGLPIITNSTKSESNLDVTTLILVFLLTKLGEKKGSHTSKKETVKYTFLFSKSAGYFHVTLGRFSR